MWTSAAAAHLLQSLTSYIQRRSSTCRGSNRWLLLPQCLLKAVWPFPSDTSNTLSPRELSLRFSSSDQPPRDDYVGKYSRSATDPPIRHQQPHAQSLKPALFTISVYFLTYCTHLHAYCLSISQVVDLLIKVLLSALWLMVWRPKEKHGDTVITPSHLIITK